MTTLDTIKLIQDCDQLLRMGQFETVQQKLKKVSTENFPRSHLAEICSLARRAHVWKLSLRWLHPIIRPQIKTDKVPSSLEIIEYSMALQKAGALQEADKLLAVIDYFSFPKALLSRAYIKMACWDYENAKLMLESYLLSKGLTDYERFIARVNLVAALVFLKDTSVEKLLPVLEADLRRANHQLLLANCLEISAQYFISIKAWSEAVEALERSEKLIAQEKNLDIFFIKKWKTLVVAIKDNDTKELSAFRPVALKLQHWETLRDLDYYQAVIQPDSFWADWCYYGTSHTGFRKRLESIRSFKDQEWIFRHPKASLKIDPWFPKANAGDLSHRCYVLLLKDLYRPLRVGEAFGALFPDEHFNPHSSPNRIHQAMNRMQKWLQELDLPFQLLETDGSYSLRLAENIQILGRSQFLDYDSLHFFFYRYKSVLPSEFTMDELAKLTDISKSNLQRMLKRAVDANSIIKSGQGRYTTYSLISR